MCFFIQAGFALPETGLTRANKVAHIMAMNVLIYSLGALGIWLCGFAFLFGSHGAFPRLGGGKLVNLFPCRIFAAVRRPA